MLENCNGNGSDRYKVIFLPITSIKPSPENDNVYGQVGSEDGGLDALVESIRERGLAEPLILTADGYILSGHRRFEACERLGMHEIPCRVEDIRRQGNPDFMRALVAYNPQRVKSVGALFREAILRDSVTLEDTQDAIRRVASTYHPTVQPEYIRVEGEKLVEPIGSNRQEFLAAVQKVVGEMRGYWPLSLRQIHYRLLNDPPLKLTPQRSRFDVDEKYRYRNDRASYDALSRLSVSARYLGKIPFYSIDDPTRTFEYHSGFENVSEFLESEMTNFLLGYHRNKQQSQPNHIEVLVEKNTLLNIVRSRCHDYYVPLTNGRGFAGPSIWRKMSERFEESDKEQMVLLIVSDFDPEGLELADDAIRSLRDLWDVPIEYHRVAVTSGRIDELGLHSDFNPAKESSSRYERFVERTGSNRTWECESLEPEYLQKELANAIEANMNMDLFRKAVEQEKVDTFEIHRLRNEIAGNFEI